MASAGLGAILLGVVGFSAGFFGPILLNPEANQGPLVGIFITGPGGLILGGILGAILGIFQVSRQRTLQTLSAVAIVLGVGTLGFCLPEPAYKTTLVEFEILSCETPAQRKAAALTYWDSRIASAPWAPPRADWKAGFDTLAATTPGVVLNVKLTRTTSIYENRKPWNKGTFTTRPGRPDMPTSYFLPGAKIDALPPTATGPWITEQEPSSGWPPENLTGLLNLLTLKPVPAEFAALPR